VFALKLFDIQVYQTAHLEDLFRLLDASGASTCAAPPAARSPSIRGYPDA
jgi:hypothetical protein